MHIDARHTNETGEEMTKPLTQHILTRALAFSFLLVAASGCSIIFPYEAPGCAPINEICPELSCDAYVVEEGCALCECAPTGGSVNQGCYSDSDCGQSERCNTDDFCDAPPGCEPGDACPGVCYGRCELVENQSCTQDSDCGENAFCNFENPDPAPRPDEDEDPESDELLDPVVSGECTPYQDCQDGGTQGDMECPEGFVAEMSGDDCAGYICRPIEGCAERSPEECDRAPECTREPNCPPCDDGFAPCECQEDICVDAEKRCEEIDNPQECDEAINCASVPANYPSSCLEECGNDNACIEECEQADQPPPQEFLCIYIVPEECFSDFDCPPASFCDEGQCNARGNNCYELSLDECRDRADCTFAEVACDCPDDGSECDCPDENLVCVSDDRAFECAELSDEECRENLECEFRDIDCDCADDDANCVCERCVSSENVNACLNDDECSDEEACVITETCRQCEPGENCEEECQFSGECVARLGPPPCERDADCAEEEACIERQCQEGARLCLEDADCPDGLRCAVERSSCECPDDLDCEQCFSICVEE